MREQKEIAKIDEREAKKELRKSYPYTYLKNSLLLSQGIRPL